MGPGAKLPGPLNICSPSFHVVALGFNLYYSGNPKVKTFSRDSLVAQWLRLQASTTGGMGLTPGQGNKTPRATWCNSCQSSKSSSNNKSFLCSPPKLFRLFPPDLLIGIFDGEREERINFYKEVSHSNKEVLWK